MRIMTTMKVLSVAVLLSLGVGCTPDAADDEVATAPAPAVQDPVMPDPVADQDQTAGMATGNVFDDWDINRDSGLDADEFNTRFGEGKWFADWDTNGDGNLSTEEFTTASANWGDAPGGADKATMFDEWDTNDDGMLDRSEFGTGAHATWDLDRNNVVDNTEYESGRTWFNW